MFENRILAQPLPLLDKGIPLQAYCPIDLSITNAELDGIKIEEPAECQHYIDSVLARNKATVAYGGYLEHRRLYDQTALFSKDVIRTIHLGVDFWCAAGTQVLAPFDGTVHSFANNSAKGDYGPTLILEHSLANNTFFTLYGHLAMDSITALKVGAPVVQGSPLAQLGDVAINGGYAPHLHFQVVLDLGGRQGDYQGVCGIADLDFFKQNCPDPKLVLGV